ncbi:MAG: hypothetical protein PSV35_02850, partial [bacterium]|nr:hypothetical protein [bacterium]
MDPKSPLQYSPLFISILLLSANTVYAGKNFQLSPAPGYEFPTQVIRGQTVSAYYNVTNLTHSRRQNYHITGLPNTVHQVTSKSYCPA